MTNGFQKSGQSNENIFKKFKTVIFQYFQEQLKINAMKLTLFIAA